MDIYKERIQPLFDSTGKTDAELERFIGIPPKTINKWKSGVVKSYVKYIAQIAKYFNVDADYLLGRTDDPSPADQKEKPSIVSDEGLSPCKKELIDAIISGDDDQAAFVLKMIRLLKE